MNQYSSTGTRAKKHGGPDTASGHGEFSAKRITLSYDKILINTFLLFNCGMLQMQTSVMLTLRRIGSTLGALRLCCTNSMANRYKLRYQCISTLTGGTGTSGIGTF